VRRDPRDEGHHVVRGFGELATGAVAIDGSAGDADLVEPAGPFATQIQLVLTAVGSTVHLLLLEGSGHTPAPRIDPLPKDPGPLGRPVWTCRGSFDSVGQLTTAIRASKAGTTVATGSPGSSPPTRSCPRHP